MADHSSPDTLRAKAMRIRAFADGMSARSLRAALIETAEELEHAAAMHETSERMMQRLQQDRAQPGGCSKQTALQGAGIDSLVKPTDERDDTRRAFSAAARSPDEIGP